MKKAGAFLYSCPHTRLLFAFCTNVTMLLFFVSRIGKRARILDHARKQALKINRVLGRDDGLAGTHLNGAASIPRDLSTSYYRVVVIRVPLQGLYATLLGMLWIG